MNFAICGLLRDSELLGDWETPRQPDLQLIGHSETRRILAVVAPSLEVSDSRSLARLRILADSQFPSLAAF